MKVSVIPIVIGALGTIPEGWIKGVEGIEIKLNIIQTTALRSARIPRRVLKTLGDLTGTQSPGRNLYLMLG